MSAFARKSPYAPDDAWDADYRQLSQYIVGAGRAADWDPKRLQFALRGAFRTKIMFLPTNAIVSCIAAYGPDHGVPQEVLDAIAKSSHPGWGKKVIARRFLNSSPLMRQLAGQPPKLGKRRSGSSARSIKRAEPAFIEINQYAQRSDQRLNQCLAHALRDNLAAGESQVAAEAMHPYLEHIIPDVQVRTDPSKIVCVEMFYTISRLPSNLADYVLKKMDRYMKQLEFFTTKQPPLFFMDS